MRPRQDIIDALARPRTQFDNRHLDSIVNRLRRKIESCSGSTAPVRVVYGVGYVFTEPCLPG